MIQFSKLRLNGFKSFVDRTEMEIGPGLTGIVGPNGCGKSNLVEALKWSMGESSSKRMRGGSGSMEDVIFNGTAKRHSRNFAEVSVLLDNSKNTAPAPYSPINEIEVTRRIERDKGSGYKINGKNVRARDVQMLYADILSGANSPFLVSQGRVTTLIQAKPSERRKVLEEAAGISGLYARRHEAELRLKATDRNLGRLEDLIGTMDSRFQSLKKQARQATRYKNLSAQIRQLEVIIAALEWETAHQNLESVKKGYAEIESVVADKMAMVTQLTKTQTTQAKDLPDLRKEDAETSAALQTKNINLQRLEDELTRLSDAREEAKNQIERTKYDHEHETQTLAENTTLLEKLEAEEQTLAEKEKNTQQDLKDKEQLKDKQQSTVDTLEQAYGLLMQDSATQNAEKLSLERQIQQSEARMTALQDRITNIKDSLATIKDSNTDLIDLDALRNQITKIERSIDSIKVEAETRSQKIVDLREELDANKEALKERQIEKDKILSNINALSSILDSLNEDMENSVFETVKANSGFEKALSRALGDSLSASIGDKTPYYWQKTDIATVPALPDTVEPLQKYITCPPELELALKFIGVVDSKEQGETLFQKLQPGQSLVSKDGYYWRWDGYCIKSEATDRHALHLEQKSELEELKKRLPAKEGEISSLEKQVEKSAAVLSEAEHNNQNKREEESGLQDQKTNLQRQLNDAIESQSEQQAQKAKFEESLSLAQDDLKSLEEQHQTDTKLLNELKNNENSNNIADKLEATKGERQAAREKLQDLIRDYEVAKQDRDRRGARLHAIADERISLQNRCIRAREKLKELEAREASFTEKLEAQKKRPQEIKIEKESLLSEISQMQEKKNAISEKLVSQESELSETTTALKEAESILAEAREKRAHAQATISERHNNLQTIENEITEKFSLSPQELRAEAALSDEAMPNLNDLKQKKEQAVRGRDMIGPVNLRAEIEAEELEKELGGILTERNDLMEAIEELRAGINKLNKEARERLNTAFAHVNAHFKEMFSRLFVGGKAHLELIESDDPLEAGLEIFAQPPGKTLQSLSLLSGGEQTLTAVALIFAMFLTNPAPICVLDEVDAPLDDANVDRFCDLLDEFADRGETRFLVITHHRLTMARMDRLYGVTMAEKGVSQLVSVDLSQQLDFLEEAA